MMEVTGEMSSVTSKSSFKWVVGFCSGCKKTGDYLISPMFSTPVNNVEYHWQLKLFPKSDSDSNQDFISIYIDSLSNTVIEAQISFILLDKHNQIDQTFNMKKKEFCNNAVGNAAISWGYPKFKKRDFVLNKANNLLTDDDKLSILCIVTIGNFQCIDDNHRKEEKKKDTSMSSKKLEVFDGLETLLDDESYSDITFEVEGNTIKAHKCILAKRSEVFAAMFKHDTMEKKQNTVVITDISYRVLKELLRFIYSGKMNETEIDVAELFSAADKYLLQGLKNMCEKWLCDNVNADNVIKYLSLADTYNANVLKTKSIDFIALDAEKLMNRPELETLSESHPMIMCSLLRALASTKKKEK